MNRNSIFSILASTLSLALLNCSGSFEEKTYQNPASYNDGPELVLSQPLMADGYHTASIEVGKPMAVNADMYIPGPGVCDDSLLGGIECSSETDTYVSFQILSIGCDDDLCDVNQIVAGDATHSTVITITPKADQVTLNVTGVSGSTEASGSDDFFPADPARVIPSLKKAE